MTLQLKIFLAMISILPLNALIGEQMLQISHIPTHEIPHYLPKLIELRAITYRNYPYLYEQNLDDEQKYIAQYVNNCAALITANYNGEIIGVAIGLPLTSAQGWIQEAFTTYEESLSDVFYIGDIATSIHDISLNNELLNTIETFLKRENKFSKIAVCEVYRENYPKENEKLNTYWLSHGYEKHEHLKSVFWWKDIDQPEKTPKELIYWIKQI